jgi:signal peptidase
MRVILRQVARALGALATAGIVFLLIVAWPQSLHGTVAYVEVSGHSMDPTYHTGDVVAARRGTTYHRGQIVAYRIRNGDVGAGVLVIHRIVGGDARSGYITRGDNRTVVDPWRPTPRDIVGAAWVVLPQAQRLLAILRTPIGLGALGGVVTVIAVHAALTVGTRPKTRNDPTPALDPATMGP